jgi:hypothetical protein
MCDHGLLYRHVQQFHQRRPSWHCGTCGRVSYRPLDCCARPAFSPPTAPLSARLSRCWGRVAGLWRLIDLPGLLQGFGQAVSAMRRQRATDRQGYEMPTTAVAQEHDHAAAAAVDYTPVGAGDRD